MASSHQKAAEALNIKTKVGEPDAFRTKSNYMCLKGGKPKQRHDETKLWERVEGMKTKRK